MNFRGYVQMSPEEKGEGLGRKVNRRNVLVWKTGADNVTRTRCVLLRDWN
jgi:hypothetical protein